MDQRIIFRKKDDGL